MPSKFRGSSSWKTQPNSHILNLGQMLFKPGSHDFSIASIRTQFLSTAERLPESRSLLEELVRPEALGLASREFYSRSKDRPKLRQLIEDWAVRCHLATRPVENWWIYTVAISALKHRCIGPL